MTSPNKRTSGNRAVTFLFHAERSRRAVPERYRPENPFA